MQSFTIVIQLNEAGAAAGRVEPRIFQEGLYMRATQGALSGLTRNPIRVRPELVINWHLPKEGQSQYQKHYFILDPVFSLREDMPPDPSIESHRLNRTTNLSRRIVRNRRRVQSHRRGAQKIGHHISDQFMQ